MKEDSKVTTIAGIFNLHPFIGIHWTTYIDEIYFHPVVVHATKIALSLIKNWKIFFFRTQNPSKIELVRCLFRTYFLLNQKIKNWFLISCITFIL